MMHARLQLKRNFRGYSQKQRVVAMNQCRRESQSRLHVCDRRRNLRFNFSGAGLHGTSGTCQIQSARCASHSGRSACDRTGFTLVELLVVISIITLLSSMVLVAVSGVTETARVDRTRAQIARIDTLITEKWEGYRSRRVPITPGMRRLGRVNAGVKLIKVDKTRVDILRELMRMEMPERKTDLLFAPAVPGNSIPSIWYAYRRQAAKLINSRKVGVSFPLTGSGFDQNLDKFWSSDFESAECLYLILSQIVTDDKKALDYFSPQEFGDIDNDGMPEILDAWGRPIIFLRWAPGLQIVGGPQDGEAADPYDLLGVYPRIDQAPTFALYPFVASAGPDRQMEIFADNPSKSNRITYALTSPPNNPFLALPGVARYLDQTKVMVGTPQDSNGDGILGWLDNITNHNMAGS